MNKTFLLLLFLLLALPAQAAEKRVALLIGNAAYLHERTLQNPVNDAVLLGKVLKKELAFDDVQVEKNLDVKAMDDAVEKFAARAQGADVVVFYYSGHGMKSSDRHNFLLPIEASTGRGDSPRLDRQAVSAESIRDQLKAAGARVTLVILDACRDGPGGGKSGNKGLTRMGGGNGLLVAYATEEDNVANDGQGKNSPYAEALAAALQQKNMTLLAQFDWVSDKVKEKYPSQSPTREGTLRADAYLLSPFGKPDPQKQERLEDEAWALCRGGATVVPCQSYLDSYPQGRYARLARVRMADLQPVVPVTPVAPVNLAVQTPPPVNHCSYCPDMVVIPAGNFMMGSNDGDSDEKQPHRVTVQSFEMGKTEVTQGQWKAVMGNDKNPSSFNTCGDDCPVENVSWDKAQDYIRKLNAKSGRRYRLPSEAEWEYAARARSTGAYWWGDKASHEYANYGEDECCGGLAQGRDQWVNTAPVGQFPANPFGLFDMHGNVWEWVEDVWHNNYAGAPTDGSAWLSGGDQARRVLRGGSWNDYPGDLRSAYRNQDSAVGSNNNTGFRLARTLLIP